MSLLSGAGTIAEMRAQHSETLIAFSTGKDAIAAYLAIQPHFERVVPYYLYLVPGLEFVEESLAYYENFFGTRIVRLPHPSLHRWLNHFVFQPPQNCLVIEQAKLPKFDYSHVRKGLIRDFKLDPEIFVADGVRAADSPMRRAQITKHGSIIKSVKKYHPVWDMKKSDLVALFQHHRIKLPVDYRLFGRTFDGLDLRFLLPLKKHRPDDYRRVLEWFPLAELEVFRWECANGK